MISKSRKEALEAFKMEAARELGIDLKDDKSRHNPKKTGKLGGNMVKKMIAEYESMLK